MTLDAYHWAAPVADDSYPAPDLGRATLTRDDVRAVFTLDACPCCVCGAVLRSVAEVRDGVCTYCAEGADMRGF